MYPAKFISVLNFLLKLLNFSRVTTLSGVFSIGDYVTMGGRVAVRDHVSIVSKVCISFPDLIRLSTSHSLGVLRMASD